MSLVDCCLILELGLVDMIDIGALMCWVMCVDWMAIET